jgi:prevent-host-death family protein
LIRDTSRREHSAVDPNRKGNVAELAIATEAAKLGLAVLKPLTEHERYDLVLGVEGRLLRVQCKWGARRGSVIEVRLRTSYHSPTRGYVLTSYSRAEVDLVAVYCQALDRCYLVPPAIFEGRATVHLRIGPTKNKQRAALNWAADYELPGAVAQLAERSDGIRKVRGSIPLSSTPEQADSDVLREEVGAHQFRNHFGYYLERAASGAEISISRRGRPYARLCSPDLNPALSPADA